MPGYLSGLVTGVSEKKVKGETIMITKKELDRGEQAGPSWRLPGSERPRKGKVQVTGATSGADRNSELEGNQNDDTNMERAIAVPSGQANDFVSCMEKIMVQVHKNMESIMTEKLIEVQKKSDENIVRVLNVVREQKELLTGKIEDQVEKTKLVEEKVEQSVSDLGKRVERKTSQLTRNQSKLRSEVFARLLALEKKLGVGNLQRKRKPRARKRKPTLRELQRQAKDDGYWTVCVYCKRVYNRSSMKYHHGKPSCPVLKRRNAQQGRGSPPTPKVTAIKTAKKEVKGEGEKEKKQKARKSQVASLKVKGGLRTRKADSKGRGLMMRTGLRSDKRTRTEPDQ